MGNYMNVVASNIPGMYSQRQLGIVNTNKSKSSEKLSSGYRINRAADDAAGLTISENMRRMIRGLTQASLNVEDGVSLCQVADGYLDEVHDMLHRCTELAVKGSNGTLTDADREAINEEVSALKKEMRRIFNVANFNEIPLFHVPYTPEIEPDPEVNDMELFHVGTGDTIGGLEFNNVRYSIAELQAKGMKIDSSGRATEDFEASFELYDGETVDISMKEGDPLSSAKRNYNWKAKDDGIYINNKLSAEWSEVTGPDGHMLDPSASVFPAGTYSFTHHGMNISFEVDEEADKDQLMAGINGDAATQPATWDVSVGGGILKSAASIDSGIQPIKVSNANQNFIDHTFAVVANADGIAIKDRNNSYTTASKAWATFTDSSKASITDENGNTIDTNGGYPIKNWGEGTDSNGASEITFDDSARYVYKVSDIGDSNVPAFAFSFKLADTASLDEVSYSLSNTMSSSKVYARGSFSTGGSNANGSLSVDRNSKSFVHYSAGDDTGDFALQRAYGRDFDDPNAKLTATISVTRTALGTDPSADTPDGSGGYSVSGHTVYGRAINDPGTAAVSSPYDETVNYYYNEETGTYHKYTTYKEDMVSTEKSTVKDRWSRNAEYAFNGTLNGTDMNTVTKPQTETWERTLTQTRTSTVVAQTSNKYIGIMDEADLTDDEKNNAIHVASNTGLPQYNYSLSSPTYSEYTTTNIGTASLVGRGTGSYSVDFNSGKGKAFTFNYSVNTDQAKALATGAAAKTVGTITFTASEDAYRLFQPNATGSITESTFNSVKLNVPKKKLNIQAGADAGNTITMEWNALNLTVIGLSGANTKTRESSLSMLGMVQGALDMISETRSTFGAYQNRFESTIRNLDNVVENTQAAESLIRDTDMAKEMVNYSKQNILEQAGTAMLTQSNQSKQWIISLLNQ